MNLIETLLNNDSFKNEVNYAYRILGPRETVMQSEKSHKYFYFICSGNVRIYLLGEKVGSKHLHPGISDFSTGEFFGELGLFNDSSGNAEVVTTSRTELIEIDILSFENFLEKNPKMGTIVCREIIKTLIKRIRQADRSIIKLLGWGLKKHHIREELE